MAVTTLSVHCSKVNFNRILLSDQQFPVREERNLNDVISMTDNEAMRTTFVRTRPAFHEAEAGCCEAEAKKCLETTLDLTSLVIINALQLTISVGCLYIRQNCI